MNLTASIAGPPHPLEGLIAQNGVSFVNTTTGTVADNTMIHGSSDQAPGPPGCGNCAPTNGTALLLFNADNLTVTRNTFVGVGTDIGVAVSAGSTGNTISFNNVTRTDSQNPANTDPTGIGISVDPGNTATLICNTFSSWNTNIVGAIQIDCTPLPDGAECQAYSAHTPTVQGGAAPFSWSLESGSLPPGLTLATDGAITGTPTTAAKFDFTLRVSDATQLTATQAQSITIAPDCQTPTPTPTPTPTTPTMTPISQVPPGESGALAATGPATGLLDTLIAGVLLLATGLTLTAFAARRRRSAAGRPDPTSSSLDDGYIE